MANINKDKFYDALLATVGPANALTFLQDLTSNLATSPMRCRHAARRPTGQSVCFSAGTFDVGKACGLRMDGVVAQLKKWCQEKDLVINLSSLPSASTKLRTHHLFKLASCHSPEDLVAAVTNLQRGLLHLCGCGICKDHAGVKTPSCANPEHTVWGTQSVNVRQRSAHDILQLTRSDSEYNKLLGVLQRDEDFKHLF